MTALWSWAAVLIVVAVAFLLLPLWLHWRRMAPSVQGRRLTAMSAVPFLASVAVVPVAVGLYFLVTNFDPDAAVHGGRDDRAILDQLAQRLGESPENPEGWALLGRSYLQIGDYEAARKALAEAWSRTAMPDDSLRLAYAEAMLLTEPASAQSMAGDLVEQVLARSPDNQTALWWGGFIAVERNEPDVAIARWTDLLATNPPAEIADVIREQLVRLGGAAPRSAASASQPAPAAAAAAIELDIRVADSIDLDTFGPSAVLFVIARSPESPMPIAVTRHSVSALPGHFSLSDAESLMPQRPLSQYETVNIVARISRSGQPTESSGDAYAETTAHPGAGERLSIVIDQIVP